MAPAHDATPSELVERLRAEEAGAPFVVLRDEAGAQRIVTLHADRATIGRGLDTDVCLDWDEEASRLHAELVRVGGQWLVVDDGLSRNGTWLGGVRVQGRRRLEDGDVLRAGRTELTFRSPARDVPGATKPGTAPPDAVHVTDAQRRVLRELCAPLREDPSAAPATNAAIAAALVVSVDAVKEHLGALYRAFGVPADSAAGAKRLRLARLALERGLV